MLLREIRSYFPPYYRQAAWAILLIAVLSWLGLIVFAQTAEPTWFALLPILAVYAVLGHAMAFMLNFIRARQSRIKSGDVARPVAYYSPGMPAASYQPTFLPPSTLMKVSVFLAMISLAMAAFRFNQTHFAPSWPAFDGLFRAAMELGFAAGCWEIVRAIKIDLSSAGRA